jgi:excisionase family DNA binding protein
MGLYDLADRLNWQQAAKLLNVSKATFFRMARKGEFNSYGMARCRFYLKSELMAFMKRKMRLKAN